MIFDGFGNMVNNDGSMINQPLSGALADLANNTATPDLVAGGASRNFVTGQSGWQITPAGDAEFGSGKFRGDITGASGTFGGLSINSSNNDAIIVNDGTNDRVLIGKLVGKF